MVISTMSGEEKKHREVYTCDRVGLGSYIETTTKKLWVIRNLLQKYQRTIQLSVRQNIDVSINFQLVHERTNKLLGDLEVLSLFSPGKQNIIRSRTC